MSPIRLLFLLLTLTARAEGEGTANFGDADRYYSHRAPGAPENDRGIGNEVLYQIFVDRFFQGNPANARLHGGRFHSPDRSNWQAFWGGDLRGVIEKLPYLRELGVTRLWLTPVTEPQLVQVSSDGNTYGPYHGYWVRDLFRLNPFFTDRGSGDYDILRELVRRAGPIGVYLDMVLNHSSPRRITPGSEAYLNAVQPLPPGPDGRPRSQAGAVFANGRFVGNYADDGHRLFNHNPNITDFNDTYQNEHFSLFDLADFDVNNPRVARLLTAAHDFWMRQVPGLAGFRLDAVANVPLSFWRGLTEHLRRRYPGIELVGEWFGAGSGHGGAERVFAQTGMTLFDFSFRNALKEVLLHGAPFSRLTEVWERDGGLGDARPLMTFLDNHDVPRLRSEGLSVDRLRQALGLLFASRGVPVVYYGLEQDLFSREGTGDPYNRPMMESFDTGHPLFQLVRRLTVARRSNPAFRYGDTHVVHSTDHVLAFERLHGEDRALFVTSKNPRQGRDTFTLHNLTFPDGDYTDVLTGRVYPVRGGSVTVSVGDGEMVLLSTSPPGPRLASLECARNFALSGELSAGTRELAFR